MGCGLAKPAKISADDTPAVSPATKKTDAKDIEGVLIVNDISLDYSQISMTDMVANAQVLVNVVIFLIKSNLAKNQLLKAVLRRMESLEPCFVELQKKNSELTKQPVINLIHVVNKIKDTCEKMTKENKNFWERMKDVVTANAQLSELSELNQMLSKVQEDLHIPLQLEEAKKIDQMFDYLKNVMEKGEQTYKAVENQPSVLPLAKRKLKNEEAFIFWFECFPSCYLIEIEDFKRIFKDYIFETSGKEIKAQDLDKIVQLITENDAKLSKIDAGQVNRFYESLPLEVPWENIQEIEKEIAEIKNKKAVEVAQVHKKEQENLQEKVKKIEHEGVEEEKKLLGNPEYLRFLVTDAWIRKQNKIEDLFFRNIFVAKNGDIKGFGTSNGAEFKLTGTVDKNYKVKLQLLLQDREAIEMEGAVKTNETVIYFGCNDGADRLQIYLDLEYWFGYSEHAGEPKNLPVFFKVVGDKASGMSYNEQGFSLWEGIIGSEFNMTQTYIEQDLTTTYKGKSTQKQTGTEISGTWSTGNNTDKFYFRHSFDNASDRPLLSKYPLEVLKISIFDEKLSYKGDGSHQGLSVWKPFVPPGYYNLGYIFTGHKMNFIQNAFVVKELESGMLTAPIGWKLVWASKTPGVNSSIWTPVAPGGYVALGSVALNNIPNRPAHQGDFPDVRCIHKSLVEKTSWLQTIWMDKTKTGIVEGSVWRLKESPYALGGVKSAPPSDTYKLIRGVCLEK